MGRWGGFPDGGLVLHCPELELKDYVFRLLSELWASFQFWEAGGKGM